MCFAAFFMYIHASGGSCESGGASPLSPQRGSGGTRLSQARDLFPARRGPGTPRRQPRESEKEESGW